MSNGSVFRKRNIINDDVISFSILKLPKDRPVCPLRDSYPGNRYFPSKNTEYHYSSWDPLFSF